ncbi:hypothetical protein OQA88_6738 [Cercophora sp. LCS_1]
MNHDPSSSLAARQRAPRPDADDDLETSDHDEDVVTGADEAAQESERQEKRKAGLAKKLQFVSHLQKSLDTIVFAYLCTLYYMECSFARLLLRVVPHYIFISPKESTFLLPAHRPHVFAIFLPNILCVFFHLLFDLPRANETTRGYLHGGVIVDFVGQKPPTWKLCLISFDILIWAVQCLMLAVHQEREKLRKAVTPSLQTVSGGQPDAATAPETTQDHDAEERGVRRDEENLAGSSEDIELQPLTATESGGQLGASYSQTACMPFDRLATTFKRPRRIHYKV